MARRSEIALAIVAALLAASRAAADDRAREARTHEPSATSFWRPRAAPPELAPGEVVALPIATDLAAVTLRGAGASWSIPTTRPRTGPGGPRGTGFVVPQLPRGTYVAAFGAGPDAPAMTFAVAPRLRAVRGVAYGAPGSIVDVAIGFAGPAAAPTSDGRSHALVRAEIAARVASGASTLEGAAPMVTGDDGVAHLRVVVGTGESVVEATAPGFAPASVRVIAGAAPRLAEARLLVGDVLLYAGAARTYSHASIVIGRDHGETLVVEVLGAGARIAPVRVSVEESWSVEVWRASGIASERIAHAAEAAKAFAERGVDRGAPEERFLLDEATRAPSDASADAPLVDLLAGGSAAMTSAELVARAYAAADAPVRVAPPSPEVGALFASDGRALDLATPVGLARGGTFAFAFSLW